VGDWRRQSDGDGNQMDGRRRDTDGRANSTWQDSKRVKTQLLVGDKGQHQRFTRNEIADIPEPSTPLPNDPKRPIDKPNPLRRRGKMKSRPREVSRTQVRRLTHHVEQSCQDRIGQVGRVVYAQEAFGEYLGPTTDDHKAAEAVLIAYTIILKLRPADMRKRCNNTPKLPWLLTKSTTL
jgi:hypothetical protein